MSKSARSGKKNIAGYGGILIVHTYESHHAKRGSGYKTATSQNRDYYKTVTTTKQRLLQNGNCYKTKRRKIIYYK